MKSVTKALRKFATIFGIGSLVAVLGTQAYIAYMVIKNALAFRRTKRAMRPPKK